MIWLWAGLMNLAAAFIPPYHGWAHTLNVAIVGAAVGWLLRESAPRE